VKVPQTHLHGWPATHEVAPVESDDDLLPDRESATRSPPSLAAKPRHAQRAAQRVRQCAAFGLRWQRPQAGDTALDCVGLALRLGCAIQSGVALRFPPQSRGGRGEARRSRSGGTCPPEHALSLPGAKLFPMVRHARAMVHRPSMKERTDRECGHIELLKISWKSIKSPADSPPGIPPPPQKTFDLHPLASFTPTNASTSDISRAREVFILANNLCYPKK
jgi:hypothetical protein